MKNLIYYTCVFILLAIPLGCANDLIGSYETRPEIFPGFKKPYSEKLKKSVELFIWRMEINEKEIYIHMPKQEGPLILEYKIEGKYLLAWEKDKKVKKYVPFYIDKSGAIHGYMNIFYRIK